MKNHPAVPIYFIAPKGIVNLSPEDLSCLTIRRVLDKSMSYSEIVKVVEKSNQQFDAEEAIRVARMNKDAVNSHSSDDEAAFVPILAKQFLSGRVSLFDLYVKLGSSRFLKILQAGDAFDGARVNEYLGKGVVNFYLRKEAQESYLQYCDQIGSVAIQKVGVPDGIKSSFVMNHGEQTMQYLLHSGVNMSSVNYARTYVGRTRDLVERLSGQGAQPLKSLQSDLLLFEHGVSMTMLGSILAREMKFHSEKSVESVGLACMLHDIGLIGQAEVIRNEDEGLMTPSQIADYHRHPLVGAQMLEKVRGISAAVIQAVTQHHERKDRMGFPHQLGAGNINCIAEIIGICDEYLKLLKQEKERGFLDIKETMENRVFPLFSEQIVEAFRASLWKKK